MMRLPVEFTHDSYIIIYILPEMPGVARAGFRTPLASIQPATKRKQHLLIVVAKHQPQNGPKENSTAQIC
jgi:hypothetical protein